MQKYKSWPFKEAQSLQKRHRTEPASPVVFETGFGPSGLPHIGTFAEVARTTWVRHAFEHLTGWQTKLIAFSDDMDGLRKVPLNMPQQNMLAENLGKPLCHIPDPFAECDSYSGYMNQKLQTFLDRYNFDYQFQSSQQAYQNGDFDEGLTILLNKYEEVQAIILPTLRKDKRENWSPFFPICESCGRIYTTQVTCYHPENGTIDYICNKNTEQMKSCGHHGNTVVTGGKVKVGWKVDWALRWFSYNVAYEMYGKDLIESAKLSGKIIRLMGKQPPIGLIYEMFLDETGSKISKSVGLGLTIDTWTKYAPLGSLLHYIFQNPKRAKRLFWDVVPKSVDDYLAELNRYASVVPQKQPDMAVWHIYDNGNSVPSYELPINYSLINNLVSALGNDNSQLIFDYLERYDSAAKDYEHALQDLISKNINYYRDFILPNKKYRIPTEQERHMLQALHDEVANYEGDDVKELQKIPFDIARKFEIKPADFFKIFYEVVMGQQQGPRFGTFAKLIGKARGLALLDRVL
ncbi:MAG: lysine--tRNA ligase [Anaerolineaceae bacterium 4572_78]|nr:MAG: lysine--tRNA ligase [Anaerolineaceae bacterium 4572_78]